MKFVSKSVLCASLFALFSFTMAETTQFVAPRLVLKTVINRTPFILVFQDRTSGQSFALPAHQTIAMNFEILAPQNITTLDITADGFRKALIKKGQFLVKAYNQSSGKTVTYSYMNLCCVPDKAKNSFTLECLNTYQTAHSNMKSSHFIRRDCKIIEIELIAKEDLYYFTADERNEIEIDSRTTQK